MDRLSLSFGNTVTPFIRDPPFARQFLVKSPMLQPSRFFIVAICCTTLAPAHLAAQEIIGVTATPHIRAKAMRWWRPGSPELAARIELFLKNSGSDSIQIRRSDPLLLDGQAPEALLKNDTLAWHDSPRCWLEQSTELPPDCLTVIALNGRSNAWAVGTTHQLQLSESHPPQRFILESPATWLSAVTFIAADESGNITAGTQANQIVVHLNHTGDHVLSFHSLRLWLPKPGQSPHVFHLTQVVEDLECFPANGKILGGCRAGFVARCEPLPRSYAVVEVRLENNSGQLTSLWAYQKIKPEAVDISGGWIASNVRGRNSLTIEEYLRTLKRMHINTGHFVEVGGYTDNPELFRSYPLKRFGRLQDLSRYDTDTMLPTIHAVEFIGEPQYGGGRPIPPQEVWEMLAPYQASRLPTSVTLSEERTWRYYAGLSDYPHYDAYRVIAPAADAWTRYDRWGDQQIRWGAPLETIGVMTRSLRELSRPRPIAYWSQGAHSGWGGPRSPRRGSPTPNELRAQAWHGLANRITSLYWFNLSLESLLDFPDLIEPITRVNREIRLIEELLLRGDAFDHRELRKHGEPDWETNVIAAPEAALLIVHDVAYRPDPHEKLFKFQPRGGKWSFSLPNWIEPDAVVFALDEGGVRELNLRVHSGRLEIADEVKVVGIYLVANHRAELEKISARFQQLIQTEEATGFDPGGDSQDLKRLQTIYSGDDGD